MELGLQGRVALVTGGSKGIGRACAAGLAAEGCRLALCARGAEALAGAAAGGGGEGGEWAAGGCRRALCARGAGALAGAAAEVGAKGAEVLTVPADLADPEAAGRVV